LEKCTRPWRAIERDCFLKWEDRTVDINDGVTGSTTTLSNVAPKWRAPGAHIASTYLIPDL